MSITKNSADVELTTPTTDLPLVDCEAVTQSIRLICGDEVTEVRALDAKKRSGEWLHTESGYFDSPEKLAEALKGIISAKGIYFTPNVIDPALLSRASNRIRKTPKGESTSDANITRRRWLPVDCDAQRASGISATDAEHDAALAMARDIKDWLYFQG